MKLIKIITFAALALTAEAKFRGRVGKNDASRELKAAKNAKADGIGGECQSCENQLPGYALFGKNYEDKDFYENLVEAIIEAIFDPGSYDYDIEFGEDFFVPGPLGFSTLFQTCYDDASSLIICGLITFIGEAIFRSELLSCLYTQILTFAREDTCTLGPSPSRKRRLLSDQQKEAVDRVLESAPSDPLQRDTMAAMALMGAESLLDLTTVLGLECGSTDNPFIEMICNGDSVLRRKLQGSEKRELLPSVANIPIAEGVVTFLEELDEFGADPDVAMAIQDNLFFVKCFWMGGSDTGLCAGLFGLLKTFDAIICRFRDERGCGSETCTKDLAFDTNFQAERLVIDLPFTDDFDIGRFLAPCDYCLAGRSGGCAAFCPYYESHHECPDSFGPNKVSEWIENGLPGI